MESFYSYQRKSAAINRTGFIGNIQISLSEYFRLNTDLIRNLRGAERWSEKEKITQKV